MSITLSFVLLLSVLLCFSYDACNARSFGLVRNETTTSKENENYKLNNIPTRVSTKTAIPNATEVAKEESMFEKEEAANISGSDEPKKHIQTKENILLDVSSGDATQGASVSWTVPHKKGGEKEPGFNLDYLPPKTHPPVHN